MKYWNTKKYEIIYFLFTISLIGIKLNTKAKKLAEKITNIGQGNFYLVKDLEELDKIVLEDYSEIA